MAEMNTPATSAAADVTESVPLPLADDVAGVTAEGFRDSFGEELRQALDLNTWGMGPDLGQEYRRIEREVREAIAQEDRWHKQIRADIFPKLSQAPAAPKGAGVHPAHWELIARIHRGLLFNGGVEACDGTVQVHDTLPLSIYQIGVSLVSYQGDRGTWRQRLFRRDLRQHGADPVAELVEMLDRRSRRGALNRSSPDDAYGELVQRALMTYGERAVLLRRSRAVWRMGHGNPVPYELVTGGANLELMVEATKLLRELIEVQQKFVFVASEPRERLLQTLGQALRPMEYAIVGTMDTWLGEWIRQKRFAVNVTTALSWDDEPLSPAEWIPRFIEQVASKVVVGVYRATRWAPAQLFYAHVDHAQLAAHIVLADSLLQEHRGFPVLIDLAHHVCASVFGDSLRGLTEAAYAAAGAPGRYFSERSTRSKG
jgi:hypothetical protein